MDHVKIFIFHYLIFRIPTYIITATYFGPVGIWLYWRYGRRKLPSSTHEPKSLADESKLENDPQEVIDLNAATITQINDHESHIYHSGNDGVEDGQQMMHQQMHHEHDKVTHGNQMIENHIRHSEHDNTDEQGMNEHHMHEKAEAQPSNDEEAHQMPDHHMHEHTSGNTPFYVSVLIGVTHCGGGCVLGDIVGEWLVYGTNVAINGRSLWPEFLIGTKILKVS